VLLTLISVVVNTQAQSISGVPKPSAMNSLNYPVARRDSDIDDYHGEKVADPYRWMEQLDSTETREWVKAEVQLTDSYLEKIPVRKELKERLTQLLDYEKFGMPFHAGKRYFYSHNHGLQPQSDLLMTDGLEGKPTLAFSPNALPKGVALAGYVASPDGKLLAARRIGLDGLAFS
jgi:prolyl oligopeptidase